MNAEVKYDHSETTPVWRESIVKAFLYNVNLGLPSQVQTFPKDDPLAFEALLGLYIDNGESDRTREDVAYIVDVALGVRKRANADRFKGVVGGICRLLIDLENGNLNHKGMEELAASRPPATKIENVASPKKFVSRPEVDDDIVIKDNSSREPSVSWFQQAECAKDIDKFWRSTLDAKKVCARCPVRKQCLDYALKNGEDDNVWGGMTPEERRRYARVKNNVKRQS